jgi:hypothetical protein
MMHLYLDDSDKFKLIDHNLKEFRELLQNPEWNLLLVEDKNLSGIPNSGEQIKIGLDFDFHNIETMKEFKRKIKEEEKSEFQNTTENKVNTNGQ